jgi:hypothetical protein
MNAFRLTVISVLVALGAYAETEPEPSPEEVRAVLLFQRDIEVPHPLADGPTLTGVTYENASVMRVEPDGIQVRHAEGITKVHFEDMPPDWIDFYRINAKVAYAYRDRQGQRDHAAWRAAQQRRQREIDAETQTLQEGHRAAEERRAAQSQRQQEDNIERQRQAWAKYDRDLALWRQTNARYVRDPHGGGRWVTIDRPNVSSRAAPAPPSFPRPK